jgi:hypothetical protein
MDKRFFTQKAMDNSLKKCIYAPDTAITREMLRSFFRPPPQAKNNALP